MSTRVKENITLIRITAVVLFVLLASWGILLAHYNLVLGRSWWALLLTTVCTGVAPELAGIVIGVVVIDALNEWRQDEQLKKQLVLQMRSRHNDVSDAAIQSLRAYGWLEDGALNGVHLSEANLEGAQLMRANLNGAMLWQVNLNRAVISRASLKGAQLVAARLDGAFLIGTNLETAQLWQARLDGATIIDTNLKGASLSDACFAGAVLQRVNLTDAKGCTVEQLARTAILEDVIMPDGARLQGPDHPTGLTLNEWAQNHEKPETPADWDVVEEELNELLQDEEE